MRYLCASLTSLDTIEVINWGLLWIDTPENYFFEYQSLNWGIGTNDAEAKHFEKIIEVIEYDFDERVALCEKYNVIYMATRVITADDE